MNILTVRIPFIPEFYQSLISQLLKLCITAVISHVFIVKRALLEESKPSRSVSQILGIYQVEWKALSSFRLILETSKQNFGKNVVFQQSIS